MVQLYYKGKNAGKVQILVKGVGANNQNPYGQQPNVIPNNLITGIAQGNTAWQPQTNTWGQGNNWGGQGNSWGGQGIQPGLNGGNSFNPQYNPYAPQTNPNLIPPQSPVVPPAQWGNVNNNNGWGDFNPSP